MFPNLLKHCELCSMNLKCYAEYTKNMIKEVLSLENILNESHIRIREEARDWEGAIRRAGEVLVQAGSIKPGYIDKMIRSVKELGPYIVIMPGFALAHAAPCEDVIKSDIALITLKNPVCFESPNDPVSVVLCLGCTDSSSHLDMLSAIAELLMEEERIPEIAKAGSTKEVIEVLTGGIASKEEEREAGSRHIRTMQFSYLSNQEIQPQK